MKIMLSVILALYNKFFADEYSVALIGSHEKKLNGESYVRWKRNFGSTAFYESNRFFMTNFMGHLSDDTSLQKLDA